LGEFPGVLTILTILFWLCLAILIYVEAGYAFLLWLIACFKQMPSPTSSSPANFEPALTVLIAAFNEEDSINSRLENILKQDYPTDRLQVIVASDGSTDGTDEIVRSYSERGVLLVRSEPHAGKITALRAAEPAIQGQVVVFSDADSSFLPGALQKLAQNFNDPKLGAISGRELRPAKERLGMGRGEGLYNRIETLVKRLEGRVGNQVLLHGGIFAMRGELLPYIPDYLTHDAIVPARLVLAGYKVGYEPEAVSLEPYELDSRQDWHRRIRTVMQAYQSYLYVKEALNPLRSGFFAIQVWSHRILRWLVLPLLVIIFVNSLLLAGHSVLYLTLMGLQALAYLAAGVGFLLDRSGKRPAFFYFPFYFVYIHSAAFFALCLSWKGQKVTTWHPVVRSNART
jgi:cellulose synthase/poly-beta-1,6-N-acetylglucosamine synthase-like glycosyltransferase